MDHTLPVRKQGHKLSKRDKGHMQELIVSCLLKQMRMSEIVQQCEMFGLSRRQLQRYVNKCYEMLAERPMEAVERLKRIEYSKIEQKQNECQHVRDWTELEKLKLKVAGADMETLTVNHKYEDLSDEQLTEVVLND